MDRGNSYLTEGKGDIEIFGLIFIYLSHSSSLGWLRERYSIDPTELSIIERKCIFSLWNEKTNIFTTLAQTSVFFFEFL